MKKLIAIAVLGLSVTAAPLAYAGPQQVKMKVCSKEAKAKGLKKDERRAFMKTCLSRKHKLTAKEASAAGVKLEGDGGK